MKIKYLLTVVATVAIAKNSFAQYSQDAALFSTAQTGSTARIKAIGNAQTAVGGDLSSVSGNPAGIGFFTHSEASFTPEFNSSSVKSSYLGTPGSASTSNLNFNNASAVFYSRVNTPRGSDKSQGWLSFNFGVSYNRTNDFYENVNYGGKNASNSISNYYANLANTNGFQTGDNSLQEWAYDHSLIDLYSNGAGGSTYKSNVQPGVTQVNNTQRDGGQQEFSLSMGANYSNQFYIGFGIGITSLRYDLNNTFTETGVASVLDANNQPLNVNFNSAYAQSQVTTGDGFNARLGFIYKPVEAFRIGATITTPTWYTIQDDYSESLATQFTGVGGAIGGPADYPFTYNFRTPWKVSGGMAVFFGHYGFISGDIDYLDYSTTTLSSADGYDASADNHDIKSTYGSAVNARVGGELKLDQLYLRAGYGVQGNPQKKWLRQRY